MASTCSVSGAVERGGLERGAVERGREGGVGNQTWFDGCSTVNRSRSIPGTRAGGNCDSHPRGIEPAMALPAKAAARMRALQVRRSVVTVGGISLAQRSGPWHHRAVASYRERDELLRKCGSGVRGIAESGPGAIIERLGMQRHPEGGWFVETWRHDVSSGRGAGTCIYFLLEHGQSSHWHRVDAAEIWHWYAGEPLELELWEEGESATRRYMLGDLLGLSPFCVNEARDGGVDGAAEKADSWERACPQVVVPANAWQRAAPLGSFALVGCTVSPAFEFERFELAPPSWCPPT